MNANDLFPPSQFLKAQDITDNGGEMVLTIKKVDRMQYEETDDQGRVNVKVKGLLEFNECDQKLALNVTNTHVLMDMYGTKDVDSAWLNKPVTLFVESVKLRDKMVPGIRIKHVDEQQAVKDAFWAKCDALFLSPKEGRDHLKEFGGDFEKALASLNAADIDVNGALELAEEADRKAASNKKEVNDLPF